MKRLKLVLDTAVTLLVAIAALMIIWRGVYGANRPQVSRPIEDVEDTLLPKDFGLFRD
jgi:hypothetical protein